MAYDVFISYRRATGRDDARLLQQALENEKRGFEVFFDYNSLRDGKFNEKIFEAIDSAAVFILMMTEGVLDRCADNGDWVCMEIEHAIDKGKKIVPVAPSDQTWSVPGNLPEKIKEIPYEQASELNKTTLFEESIDKIVEERFPDELKRKCKRCSSSSIPSSVSSPTSVFVGRDKELAKLHELLVAGKMPVVTGAGGTGKSHLVFQYATRYCTNYPGGLFQIDMENATSWSDAFQRLLRPASAPGVDMNSVLGLKKRMRNQSYPAWEIIGGLRQRAEQNGQVLLVLDNVESVKLFMRQSVLDRLNLPSGISLLATARMCDIIFRQTDRACEFQLSDLAPEEALQLLLGGDSVESESELAAAKIIAAILDYRALNLRMVPEWIDNPYSPCCGSYVALEAKLRKDLHGTVDDAMIHLEEGDRTPSALWSLTCEMLCRHPYGSKWVDFARVASFFSPEGGEKKQLFAIWKEINGGSAEAGGLKLDKVLDLLQRHGLLDIQGETFRMHRLIREAVRLDSQKRAPDLENSIGEAMARLPYSSEANWFTFVDSHIILGHIPSIILDHYTCVALLLVNQEFANRCPWEVLDGGDWAWLLSERPQFADRCPWEKLNSWDWAKLLGLQPQFADRCPWEKLDGGNWTKLLGLQPQFADRCPWERLDNGNWAGLLGLQPQFADRCPWERLDNGNWAGLLGQQPKFADRCPWERLEGYNWAYLLGLQPKFADRCPWEKLDGGNWAGLLGSQPQFADRCPWEKLDGGNWAGLLGLQPQFADRCPWEMLNGYDWAYLLGLQPQFADGCPWEKLDGGNWAELLDLQPQFADRCSWEKLNGRNWAELLGRQPQFAERCPWEKLDGSDWATLLGGGDEEWFAQPQFAERCPWKELDLEDLESVFENRPQLASICPLEQLEQMGDGDWGVLLADQPQLADKCPWEKFGGEDWVGLLGSQPQFADRCPWEKLNGSDWAYLLGLQPQFADGCPWEKLDGGSWAKLLGRQPQFADRCPWEKFDGDDWAYLLSYQPNFADICPWGKWIKFILEDLCNTPFGEISISFEEEKIHSWGDVFRFHPQLIESFPWEKLDGGDWARLLRVQPQFASRCPREKLCEQEETSENYQSDFLHLLDS